MVQQLKAEAALPEHRGSIPVPIGQLPGNLMSSFDSPGTRHVLDAQTYIQANKTPIYVE